MLFSSISFLYYFLPCVLILYFLSPRRFRNLVLLLASLVFYAWGEPKYVLLMLFSIGIGYAAGLLIERYRGYKSSKYMMTGAVILCLFLLVYFKYANFFADNLNRLLKQEVLALHIALPIGISFFTFQIISYIIDVYRGAQAQKNVISLAAYISMFPQLIAGPIVRYVDIAEQLEYRRETLDDAAVGIRRFVIGFGKKMLLANVLGEFCDIFHASSQKSVLFFWLYAIAYALHVYFDFSGYSDMAIGLGRVFGFHFMENFNYPFVSKSATEFWRRWHISLGSWFRDYVYIPLGGNRKGKMRQFFNIFVVWMLTGFWHGAAWNFVVWGLFFGVVLVIEKLWLLKWLEKSGVLSRVYILIILLCSFVIFGASDMGQAVSYLGSMFGLGFYPILSAECLYYLRSYGVVFVLAVLGAMPIVKNTSEFLLRDVHRCAVSSEQQRKDTCDRHSKDLMKYQSKNQNEYSESMVCRKVYRAAGKILAAAEPFVLLAILIVGTAYLVDGSFNPFLYFRF